MENNESKTTQADSTKELIKSKFFETFTFLRVLSTSITEDTEMLRALQGQALAKRHNNPEMTFEGIRNEILKTHETTTLMGFKEQDTQKYIARLMLLFEMAGLAGVDLEMNETDQKEFDYLLVNTKNLFAVDTNTKELKIADTDVFRAIYDKYVSSQMTDTRVEEIFNSPYFSPKK